MVVLTNENKKTFPQHACICDLGLPANNLYFTALTRNERTPEEHPTFIP